MSGIENAVQQAIDSYFSGDTTSKEYMEAKLEILNYLKPELKEDPNYSDDEYANLENHCRELRHRIAMASM